MYTLLVTGDVPGAATYFNPLLQQTVIPCTSGTRPSSPPDGMLLWETDTERYTSWNASAGAWLNLGMILTTAYSPTLTGSTTNPTLGTGGSISGRYTLYAGNWCNYRGIAKFGTSGTNAGSGSYSISLPFNTNANITTGNHALGHVYVLDSSAPAAWPCLAFASASGSSMSVLVGGSPSAGPSQMSNTVPMAWAASDYISWNITYEIA